MGRATLGNEEGQTMKTATRQKWEGRWEQLKGKAKSLWGNLTDNDLLEVEGDYQRLLGKIEERSGEAREEIERRLDA
jgi:uncharacterized protein YjbJ (UPF0337 family)